jgi:tetratricopeptide (TPR) repeat protein
MNRTFAYLLVAAFVVPISAQCDDKFPYTAACKSFALKLPKRPLPQDDDAAWGIGAREPFETKGMQLHEQGKWRDSNCYLIHALNISSDHSVNLINAVGFNYAALGNDAEALKYFEDATGFTWDLDGWLKHKAKPPFNKILNKPIYKNYEQSLFDYYKHIGMPVPKY